jgi:hypothetical protein
MNVAEQATIATTIAYLFRHLPEPRPTAKQATDEIMSHFNPKDWDEAGLERCRWMVGHLLTGGRDGPDKRVNGAELLAARYIAGQGAGG